MKQLQICVTTSVWSNVQTCGHPQSVAIERTATVTSSCLQRQEVVGISMFWRLFLFSFFFSRRLWTNTTTTSTLTEQYSRERERGREREYSILSSSPTMPEQMKSACLPESSGSQSSSAWASGMLYAAVFVQEERGCWLTGVFQRASSRKTERMEPRDTVPCSQKTLRLQLVVILCSYENDITLLFEKHSHFPLHKGLKLMQIVVWNDCDERTTLNTISYLYNAWVHST